MGGEWKGDQAKEQKEAFTADLVFSTRRYSTRRAGIPDPRLKDQTPRKGPGRRRAT